MFDEAQLPCVKDAIKGYGAATGAKVNKEKINGLQLGCLDRQVDTILSDGSLNRSLVSGLVQISR